MLEWVFVASLIGNLHYGLSLADPESGQGV